jgi:gas vesicle structural protein
MAATAANRYAGGPSPSGLADVLDLILDKGLVIDLYVRVSLVGIELLTIDARIVVASVDTYLRFAEAVGRLSLGEGDKEQISGLLGSGDREAE